LVQAAQRTAIVTTRTSGTAYRIQNKYRYAVRPVPDSTGTN